MTRQNNSKTLYLYITGILLILFSITLVLISPKFEYGLIPKLQRPYTLLVATLILAGIIYLTLTPFLKNIKPTRNILIYIFAIGLIMRISMFFSTTIHEDDWYRYLWDGAMSANGYNSFALSPDEALYLRNAPSLEPNKISELAEEAGVILERVNHPHLRTIYPPVTQFGFALAYYISPFKKWSWRFVLLLFDIGIGILLFKILQHLKLPIIWITIYWWNPLALKEMFNSAHMDLITIFCVVLAYYFYLKNRFQLSIAAIALGIASKVWPVLLLPFFLRQKLDQPKTIATSLVLTFMITAIMYYPVIQPEFTVENGMFNKTEEVEFFGEPEEKDSGFGAYAQSWEMNDLVYMAFVWANKKLEPAHKWLAANILGDWYYHYASHAQKQARFNVILILFGIIIALNIRKAKSEQHFIEKSSWIIIWLYILSPTQFPWYFIWLLPYITIQPRLSLLLYSALLPLYYSRFYFAAADKVNLFDYGIVWIEHAPVLTLLILEALRDKLNIPFPNLFKNETD